MLKHERIEHWIKNGAQLSDTVTRLTEDEPGAAGCLGYPA